jgi:hypothetical protein
VLFVARKPDKCYFASEAHTDAELCALIDALDAPVIEDIRDVPRVLETMGILPDAKPSKPSPVRSVHVKVQRADFYYLYNTHTVYNVSRPETIYPRIDKSVCMCEFDACFSLAGVGEVYEIDAFDGKVKRLPSRTVGERTEVQLSFARDEAKIIAVLTAEQAKALGVKGELAPALHQSGERILRDWTVTVERMKAPENPASTFYESMWEKQAPVRTDALRPWNELCEAWNEWSGNATYETSFSLDEVPRRALFKIEQVCDTYEVCVNGISFAQGDPARHETDITSALTRGENTLRVLVAGTLKNAVTLEFLRRAAPPDRPKTAQRQGMWGQIKIELYE